MNRRDFIKVVSTTGSGLVLGFYLPYTNKLNGKPSVATLFEPNAWIKVQSDNIVQIMVGKSEMGQGVLTSLPMIIAEEMDLDWSKVVVEKAPANRKKYGWQMTGGSNSVSGGYNKLRQAGATAREMLVMAASEEWSVPISECNTNNGNVIHERTGRKLSYGDLAEKASQLKVPKKPTLKDKSDFSIIGQNMKRTDTLSKINGTAQFAMDVQLDGMVYATMVHSPVFGGKLKSFNKASVSDISGVINIFAIESGLAIVAKNTWAALKTGKQIEIKWDEGEAAGLDDETISIHTLQFNGQIIAVALLIAEGGLDAQQAADVFAGKRRLKGHLVAQSLAANVGIEEAPTLKGERISRVAVHPDFQRQGFGTKLLKSLKQMNFDDVARRYNGKYYRRNHYAEKMRRYSYLYDVGEVLT